MLTTGHMPMTAHTDRTITIRSLPLAAYIAAKGYMPTIRRHGDKPLFTAPDCPEVRQAREEWRTYQADADPDRYFGQVAQLRAAIAR